MFLIHDLCLWASGSSALHKAPRATAHVIQAIWIPLVFWQTALGNSFQMPGIKKKKGIFPKSIFLQKSWLVNFGTWLQSAFTSVLEMQAVYKMQLIGRIQSTFLNYRRGKAEKQRANSFHTSLLRQSPVCRQHSVIKSRRSKWGEGSLLIIIVDIGPGGAKFSIPSNSQKLLKCILF